MLLKRVSVLTFAVVLVQLVLCSGWAEAGSCLGDCRRDIKNCHNMHVEKFELAWSPDLWAPDSAWEPDLVCLSCDLQPTLEDLEFALTTECGEGYRACIEACLPDDPS